MSWKLTKKMREEFKKTHLDPLVNASSTPKIEDSSPVIYHDGFNTFETIPIPLLQGQLGPGILTVTLYEGVGFSAPAQYRREFNINQHYSRDYPMAQSYTFIGGKYFYQNFHHRLLPYAILDFDKSQVFVDAIEGTTDNPLWAGDRISYKFDVSRIAELTVNLYLRNPPDAPQGSQDIFLGVTKMNPLFEEKTPLPPEWLDVQDGTGKIHIRAEYIPNRIQKISFDTPNGNGSVGGGVGKVKKQDNNRLYASKEIYKSYIISWSKVAHNPLSQINNAFIVPLKFAFESPKKLDFLSPFITGGHLFYYLQRERRFNFTRSRFYTAELLCALEGLHDFDIIYYDLKPGNILLDSLGHIAICDFGLWCKFEKNPKKYKKDKDRTICGTLEYPAPELLLSQGYTKTVDWWTLGVFLYEMLIGMPPFYDEDTNERHRKILSEPLQFPSSLSLSTKDILTRLLNRKPEQRLGANGASEIKAHPFFHSIDWHKLLQRKYEPPFKPNDVTICFKQNKPPTLWEVVSGWTYNRPAQNIKNEDETHTSEKNSTPVHNIENKDEPKTSEKNLTSAQNVENKDEPKTSEKNLTSAQNVENKDETNNSEKNSTPTRNIENKDETNTSENSTLAKDYNGSSAIPGKDETTEAPILPDKANPLPSKPSQAAVEEYDPWVLIWEEPSREFCFYNRSTNARQPVNTQVPDPVAPTAQNPLTTLPAGGHDPTIHGDYNYTVHNVPSQSQMKEALEAALKAGYKHVVPQLLEYGIDLHIRIFGLWQTPLEWATEHENLDLVKLFLDKGADPNFTFHIGRHALIEAVKKGNQELVKALVQKTDRVPSTRALGLAVDLQDSTIVNILLVNGVSCDFEELDRPRPKDPDSYGCTFYDISEPEIFMPPLVRAVKLGDINLVRLLLANGADADVGYHNLADYLLGRVFIKTNLTCGRVIQLAMELEHQEIVQLLLDSGADISLAQPIWRFHQCNMIPRVVYLKVTADLSAAAAAAAARK